MHIKDDQMIIDKKNRYETKSRIKDTLKPMDKINKLNVTSFKQLLYNHILDTRN